MSSINPTNTCDFAVDSSSLVQSTCDEGNANLSHCINEEWKEDNQVLFNPSNATNINNCIISKISSPETTPHHSDKRFKITTETGNPGSLGLMDDSSTTYSANVNNDEPYTHTVETKSQINNTLPVDPLSPHNNTLMEKLCNGNSKNPDNDLRNHARVDNDILHNMSYKQC